MPPFVPPPAPPPLVQSAQIPPLQEGIGLPNPAGVAAVNRLPLPPETLSPVRVRPLPPPRPPLITAPAPLPAAATTVAPLLGQAAPTPAPSPAAPVPKPPPRTGPATGPQPPVDQNPDLNPREPPTAVPIGGMPLGSRIDLTADRQEYDDQNRIFTATGRVVMRLQNSVLKADRLRVNLVTRIGVAEGNVSLTQGQQVANGERLEYNFALEQGVFFNARGEVNRGNRGQDFSRPLANDVRPGAPQSGVPIGGGPNDLRVQSVGGLEIQVGTQPSVEQGEGLPVLQGGVDAGFQGTVGNLRFEAERIDFDRNGWVGRNVRLTNDPFSPPELELRAETAQLTRISPLEDELVIRRTRLVFDQKTVVPLPNTRRRISRRQQRDESPVQFAFDDDLGGFYVQRPFDLINTPTTNVTITPQLLIQRAFTEELLSPNNLALETNAQVDLGTNQALQASVVLTGLDLEDLEDQLRADVRYRRLIGTHTLTVQYNYRARLFNGSLGRQTVRSSYGAIITSPTITFGNGFNLTYQASAQVVNAESDFPELINIQDDEPTLQRYQVAAALSRAFILWQGKALPLRPDAALRYSPTPIVPFVRLLTGVSGQYSLYSSGDRQGLISGTVGLQGTLGHFSKPFFDFTSFNVVYSQGIRDGESPFEFDRVADVQVVSAGFLQQVYGPIRAGVQASWNLDTGELFDLNFTVRYDRRTYSVVFQFNPEQRVGSLGLRINDFNWTGPTERFSAGGITPVSGGVERGVP